MADLDFRRFRPANPNATMQPGDLFLYQPVGATEPLSIPYEKAQEILGSGGGGGPIEITDVEGLEDALDEKQTATEILTLPASSGSITLTFDNDKVYNDIAQTGNISLFNAVSGNIKGKIIELTIIGDDTSNLSVPAHWVNGNLNSFDNTKLNDFFIEYKASNRVIYNVISSEKPATGDITAPTYNVQTVTGTTSSGATFNAQLNESGAVHWMVTTSASAPSKANILSGTGAVGSNFSSISVSAGVTNSANITGLSSSSTYYVWHYAEDIYNNETAVQSTISFSTTTSDVTAPSLISASTNGLNIILTYDEPLGSVIPANSDFTLNLSKTATTVNVINSTVVLGVSSPYAITDVPTISYTPGTNKIQDSAGNLAASFSGYAIQNNYLAFDDFNAVDTTNIVGRVTYDNIPWVFEAGSGDATIGIVGNQAKVTSGTNATYTKNVGVGNIDSSFTIGIASGSLAAVPCYASEANRMTVNLISLSVTQVVSNSGTTIFAGSGTSVQGDVIRITVNGTNLNIYRNGVLIHNNPSINPVIKGTKIGIRIANTISTIDAINAVAL